MKDRTMSDALAGFERRVTLRLYAFGVAVVVATVLLRHFQS